MDWKQVAEIGFLLLAAVFVFYGMFWMDKLLHWLFVGNKDKSNGR